MKTDDIKLKPLLDTLRLEKIDDSIYFSQKYSSYVSNSRLGLLNPKQDGTAEKFFAGFKSGGYSSALELGSAVHELTLQSDLFRLADDFGKPTAKLGAMADALFPAFLKGPVTITDAIAASNKIDYYKGKMDANRFNDVVAKCTPYWEARSRETFDLSENKEVIYLDAKSRETVLSCVNSLNSNKAVQALLHPEGIFETPISENEQAILLDVEATCPNGKKTILHLKSKIDNYTIDVESSAIVVNDIKTIGKIVSEIDSNIVKYHYSREFAMYIYLLRLCAMKFYNIENPKISANYLVVSTIPSYYSKVRPVSYSELMVGFHEFKVLLKYVAYLICYKDYSLDEL